MVERVFVPIDGSSQSVATVRFTASKWPDAGLTLLSVINPVGVDYRERALGSSEKWLQMEKRRAGETFAEVKAETGLVDADRPATDHTKVGSPQKFIVEVLVDDGTGYNHVVMGNHGRIDVSRILFGNVVKEILRRSPVSVTIVR